MTGVEAWESLLGEVEGELVEVEALLADLDDLDALHNRVRVAVNDGSIDHRPVLKDCAARLYSRSDVGT